MTVYYSDLRTNDRASPPVKNDVTVLGGRVRYVCASFTAVAGSAAADTIELFYLPKGARILPGSKFFWQADGGTATIAVGDSGSAARYLAATAVVAAGSALMEAHLASGAVYEEPAGAMVLATIGTAALTAAKVFTFHFFYSLD